MKVAALTHSLKRIFNLSSRSTPRIISALRRNVSGQFVDEDSALTFSAYFACIRVISEDIAGFPWHVIETGADGSRELVPGSRVGRLLRIRPNAEQTAFNMRQSMLFCALGWGNAYAEIERDVANRPVALWPIHPRRVTVSRDEAGALIYRVSNERGPDSFLRAADMFHLMGPTEDGSVGMSVAMLARNTIGLGIAAEQFGSSFFGNGAHPGAALVYPGQLSEKARDNMRESWQKMHQGADSSNKVAILEEGIKYEQIGIPPGDAQFLETRNFQIEDVVRWFRVPPHKIQHLLRATFNNIEQLNLNYSSDALLPWVLRLEQEADAKLLSNPAHATKLDLRGLLRADSKTRGEFYTRMFQLGMSINEIRALEDLNPIGADGDARFVPVNVQTVEHAIEPLEPPAPPPAPETDDEGEEGDEEDDGAGLPFENMLQVALDRCDRRYQHRIERGAKPADFIEQHRDYCANEISHVLRAFNLPDDARAWAHEYEHSGLNARQLIGAHHVSS